MIELPLDSWKMGKFKAHNTYMIIKLDKADDHMIIHDHINGIEGSITFTKEPVTGDGSVPFLDTKCIPQPDGTTYTVVYRRPTHTDLYVQWDSNHPLCAKLSVVSSLYHSMHRASTVCCLFLQTPLWLHQFYFYRPPS